jgi:hypothetical protein
LRGDFNRTRNSNGAVDNLATGFYEYGAINTWGPWTDASGKTRMISFVAKPFKWMGLSYNRSSAFQPQPSAVNLYGNVLPNTYGHTHEEGIFLKTPDDKLVFSVKRYNTDQEDARSSNTTLGSRVARLEAGTGSDPSLLTFATNVATARLGTGATQDQLNAVINSITQFPAGFAAANAAGLTFAGTQDLTSKGYEAEITYSPTYNWNIKLDGAQTAAINTSIENDVASYIALRMPYWLTVKDDSGNLWWTSNGNAALNFYTGNISAPLQVDQALLGKSNPQVKKYTFRTISTYRFTQGFMKSFTVGGSAAWNDRSAIGYLGATPDADGIVRSLDVNKPIYDPSRYTFDFWSSYALKLWSDRIGARIQLNVQNAFEGGRLQAASVNPDGTVYNWRIINPRKFVLSTTFDF